ncbi:cupin domain-containing protein [Thermodesulforhabdus norvegica]|uniref:Cupin domain-containing protein n=1 Tax=Thermodesulforhabdus norvegica TaxID=39841 RepID=A0A1I4R450_9BACT|nr:cupin domain-containing protein [Thermodesulforhabdus norvegica]SFM47031.1 Cupin domain-containing protein [Thermodesulforhabdus norvegica]
MYYVREGEVAGLELPGRLWKKLVGPEDGNCRNMIFGVVIFPPGSDPGSHRHENEEEIIYVISGRGETTVEGKVYRLEPGVAVFTSPGEEHGVKNTGSEPLVLISVFSPPVRPGSYDRKEPNPSANVKEENNG